MNLVEIAPTLPVIKSLTYDQSMVTLAPGSDEDVTFVGDAHAALAVVLNMAGKGHLVKVAHIVSPTAMTVLWSATGSSFAKKEADDLTLPTGSKYIGALDGVPVLLDDCGLADQPIRTIGFSYDGDLKVSEVFLKNISFF